MSDPMQEIRATFFAECEDLLERLQDALQTMDTGQADPETINVAFRAVHSVKGGAGAFGMDQLVAFAHHFETAMETVRDGTRGPDPGIVAIFFRAADMLSDLVKAAREDRILSTDALPVLTAELSALREEPGNPPPAPAAPVTDDPNRLRRYTIAFAPAPELYDSGNEPLFLLRALSTLGTAEVTCRIGDMPGPETGETTTAFLSWDITLTTNVDIEAVAEIFEFVEGLCELTITGEDLPEETTTEATGDKSTGAETAPPTARTEDARGPDAAAAPGQAATVRVELDRIDRLVNLVGELVINQAMLSQSIDGANLHGNGAITSGLDEFQQLTRDIQDSVMMIRAQPVKSLFQRMARIVREASTSAGKPAKLVTEGETTEIDKTVIEHRADPLTHMIRNAVDHGIEGAEAHHAAGKPEEGTIRLTAAHRSGQVIIEASDDGGGIDRAKVRAVAERKGLVGADAPLTDMEIDNLLFMTGFSTADSVSDLSGRGVGMDVVKTAIAGLGGRIAIQSEPGAGSLLSISLPLTLAVLDGMVVRVRGETLVVPISTILETVFLQRGDAKSLGSSTRVVQVRESFVPLIDVGAELGYGPARADYAGAIVLLTGNEDGSRAALVVDEIEDQRQVVIKGIEQNHGHIPGVAAATILGDGQIALILDPADLLTHASGRSRPELALTG